MVQKNERYEVIIEANGAAGEGIARIEGFTVFVPGGVIGDRAEILILKVKKNFAFAKILTLLSASPDREGEPCPAVSRCGGCQLLPLRYEKQLAFKRQKVVDALERIGGFAGVEVEECVPSPDRFRYRNKMIFPIGKDKEGKAVFGFYAPRSHRVVPLSDCLLCSFDGIAITRTVCDFLNRHSLPPYDEEARAGFARRLFLREARNTKEIMVVLSVNGEELPHKDEFIRGLTAQNPHIQSIVLNVNKGEGAEVLGAVNKTLWGKDQIEEKLFGLSFLISPHSFYQVNPAAMELLYQTALDFAELTQADRVFDLYCGIGTISLCAALRAGQVTGVESVGQAVADARENARRNGIKNAVFFEGDAAVVMPRLCREGEKADVVILDPPRKGSDPATLQAILEVSPGKIVYISCDPATLARDLRILADGGYEIQKVRPVDMFPNTSHVECCCLLERA